MMHSESSSRLSLPLLITLALSCALLLPPAAARPQHTASIEKRVSDQRLAELETLLALAVNSRRMNDMPVGFGLIDPHAIGRRKRSSAHPLSDALFRELSRNPSSYNSLLHLLNSSYLQQEEPEDSLQMAKMAVEGSSQEYGSDRGSGRSSLI